MPISKKNKITCLNDWRPLLWHPSSARVLRNLSETTSALCFLLYWTHYNLHTTVTGSTDDAIAFTLHNALSHLENKNTYVRMLFVDYSSAFNTIVPCHTGCEAPDSGTEQISEQLDPGLPDRQKSGGSEMGNNTSSSPGPQHWCSSGLRPQPHSCTPWPHTDCTATHSSTSLPNLPMTQWW